MAAREEAGALAEGVADVGVDLGQVPGVDERPHVRLPVHRAGHAQFSGRPREGGDEAVPHPFVDVDAFDGHAQLARIREARLERARHRPAEVGVLADDERILSAEFGGGGHEPGAGLARHLGSGGR